MANASSTLGGVAHFTYGTELEMLVKPKKIIHDALEKMGFDHTVRPGSRDASADDVESNRKVFMKFMAGLFTEAGVPTDSADSKGYERSNVTREPKLEDIMDPAGGGYCEFQSHLPRPFEPFLLPKINGE